MFEVCCLVYLNAVLGSECHMCIFLTWTVHQLNSSSMSFSPGSIMMAGGDGLHGDEAGRKRELRLLKNKLVRARL